MGKGRQCPTLRALRHPAAPDALLDLARALADAAVLLSVGGGGGVFIGAIPAAAA